MLSETGTLNKTIRAVESKTLFATIKTMLKAFAKLVVKPTNKKIAIKDKSTLITQLNSKLPATIEVL